MKQRMKRWLVRLSVLGMMTTTFTACDGFGSESEEEEDDYYKLTAWADMSGRITIPTDTAPGNEEAWYMMFRLEDDGGIVLFTQVDGVVYDEDYPYRYDRETQTLSGPEEGITGAVSDWATDDGRYGINMDFFRGEDLCESMRLEALSREESYAMLSVLPGEMLEPGRSLHGKEAILGYWHMDRVESSNGSFSMTNLYFNGLCIKEDGTMTEYRTDPAQKVLEASTYEGYRYDPRRKWFWRAENWMRNTVTMKRDSMSMEYEASDYWQKITYVRTDEERFRDLTAGLTVQEKK